MQPGTSVVFVSEGSGEGSIDITNNASQPELLYVKVIDLPDDPQPKLLVTQPIVRVNAGETQRVRFILNAQQPLTREHFKRVTFEGMPLVSANKKNSVEVNIIQNLPVIIRPTGLGLKADPWRELRWTVAQGQLQLSNPSLYVVRMGASLTLLPGHQQLKIEKGYVLPGEKQSFPLKDLRITTIDNVRYDTVSQYGYKSGEIEQPVSHSD